MALLKSTLLKLIKELPDSDLDKTLSLKSALKSEGLSENLKGESYSDGLTSSNALYTSYHDLITLHQDLCLRGIESFADIGAGIARSKIIFDLLRSPFQSFSYEFVPERVAATLSSYKKLGLSHQKGIQQIDLKEVALPDHSAYLIYLPVGDTLNHIIKELKKLSLKKERYLYVIESHGDLLPFLRKSIEPLIEIASYTLKSQRHDPFLHVFRLESCNQQMKCENDLINFAREHLEKGVQIKGLKDFQLYALLNAFQENPFIQILIKENTKRKKEETQWLASVEGWKEGPIPDSIETTYPPRIVKKEELDSLILAPEFLRPFIQERRNKNIPSLLSLRKIIVGDVVTLEYSNGALIPLEQSFKLKKREAP